MGKDAGPRDILAEILASPEEDVATELEELYKVVSAENRPASSDSDKDGRQQKGLSGKRKGLRKKRSYYFTSRVLEELDEAQVSIKDLAPSLGKSNITKSNIVDLALHYILDEYKSKGMKSPLIQKLLQKRAKNKPT